MNEPRYNIRAVERRTGVPAATLRSWERRYGFPSPDRSPSARRLYSEREVAAIAWVRVQTARGLSAAQAVRWAQRAAPGTASDGAPPVLRPQTSLTDQLLQAAARYDEPALHAVQSEAYARFSPDDVLLGVIVPALYAIGEQWAGGDLPVSAEHFATNVIQRRLQALWHAQPPLTGAPAVILACVPGEQHALGLLMLGLFLRWAGVRALYLGADVPVVDLMHCLRDSGAPAVCLSATATASAPALHATLTALSGSALGCVIAVGGPAARLVELPPGVVAPEGDLRAASAAVAALVTH